MKHREVRTLHRRVVIDFRFDWKSMAVMASAYLIRRLLK